MGMSVSIGDVADHSDGGGAHRCIIIGMDEHNCEALFFTSKPNWSIKSRRASKEELAMANFVFSRTTYLAYVIRPKWDFEPSGLTFPLDWVQSLRREFQAIIPRVIEVAV